MDIFAIRIITCIHLLSTHIHLEKKCVLIIGSGLRMHCVYIAPNANMRHFSSSGAFDIKVMCTISSF